MRILYLLYLNESVMYQWQIDHFIGELQNHHSFTILNSADYPDIKELNNRIIELMESNNFDIFMTCLTGKHCWVSTLKRIRQKKLLFCPDNLVAPFNHKSICPYFDLVWLTSVETQYLFKRWGAKTVFLPYAANPSLLTPVPVVSEISSVAFVGTPHGSRVRTINHLLKNGVPVTIYTSRQNLGGNRLNVSLKAYISSFCRSLKFRIGWKLAFGALFDKITRPKLDVENKLLEMRDPVPLNSLSSIYSKHALVLSFTEANSTGVFRRPVDIVNLRNFEIPMSGGIQMCRYTNEMATYFVDNEEIVFYRNKKELVIKAKAYLSDYAKGKREKIRIQARKKAIEKHTWEDRFAIVFRELFKQE